LHGKRKIAKRWPRLKLHRVVQKGLTVPLIIVGNGFGKRGIREMGLGGIWWLGGFPLRNNARECLRFAGFGV
jgi:hypothetical protein